jgi:hypothetical protein
MLEMVGVHNRDRHAVRMMNTSKSALGVRGVHILALLINSTEAAILL